MGLNSELLTGLSGASCVHRPQSRPLVDNSQGQLLSQECILCDGAGSARSGTAMTMHQGKPNYILWFHTDDDKLITYYFI